jgi:tetratricopeptide (TPR) repeat protein
MYPLATKPGFNIGQFALIVLIGALLAYGAFVYLHPVNTPLNKARALLAAGKAAAALPILEELARKQPDDATVLPYLAQCYLNCDRLAEGRTALDTAIRLNLSDTIIAPTILTYANYYESRHDFEEAEALFDSHPTDYRDLVLGKVKLYLAWGQYAETKGELNEAIEQLQKADHLSQHLDGQTKADVSRRLSDLLRQVAALSEVQGKNDTQAITYLKESLSLADEPQTRMDLANIYARHGKYDEAIANLNEIVKHDQHNLEARHRLIELLIEQRSFVKAQEALLDLTDKERSVENYELLTTLNLKLKNYAGAVRALEDAINLRANDLSLLNKLETTLADWSQLLAKQGKTQEAASVKGHAARVQDMIATIIKSNPEDADGVNFQPFAADGSPLPLDFSSSKIWLAKGSLTPEGQIVVKNVSDKAIDDLSLTVAFYDNTAKKNMGAMSVSVASASSQPLESAAKRTLYFSCPNIANTDHHLAVIIFYKGQLLKELPVVKQR